MSDIYNFRERRYCAYRHRIKVFIFGVDVSPWLRGTVSVVYGNRDSFNTASLEISNPKRIWQLTRENLENPNILVRQDADSGFRMIGGEYSEAAKRRVFKLKSDINQEYNLQTTRTSHGLKKQTPISVDSSGNVQFSAPADDVERKYRFCVNDCIFNKHDPIRIFVQNPLRSESDEWVEVFCGFVQDHPVTTDYFNGTSFVRISAYCIRHMMTKMRVQQNALQDGISGDLFLDSGFFADFARSGILSQPYAKSSLQDTIRELVLGDMVGQGFDAQAKDSSASLSNRNLSKKGVGQFSLGNIVCYDPANPGNWLERWHLMTVFGCNRVPFPDENIAKTNLWLTTQQMNTLGRETIWHPARTYRGPDARYLHFLLPQSGTGASALIESTVAQGPSAAEFTTRWEIIKSFSEKLDFQVLTSPSGDLLVEFPMYGFTPSAFTGEGKNHQDDASVSKKGLQNIFTFGLHQKEETLNDEGEDFPTVLAVSGGNANEAANPQAPPPRSFIYSPALASRYGVIVESVDYPFAGQTASEISGSLASRLSRLGMVEYTKRLANSSTWEGTLAYRPFMFPNRPLHLQRSNRIGNITAVTYNWQVGKEAGVSVSLNNLMAERIGKDGKSSFRLLTGALNTPISYATLWGHTGDKETGEAAAQPLSGVHSPATNNVSTPSGASPSEPEKPQSAQQVRERVTNPPAFNGLDKLYPPFRKKIEALLEECKRQGLNITVRETFRTPERQQAIFNSAKGTGTNAEAFKSWHQYGLAVDVAPVLDKSAVLPSERAVLARVNAIQQELGLGLVWGGNFRSFYDGYHFEKPKEWISLKEARSYLNRGEGYLEAVWKHITQRYFPEEGFNPKDIPKVTGSGAIPGNQSSPLTPPAAEPCTPKLMEAAGFDNLPDDSD